MKRYRIVIGKYLESLASPKIVGNLGQTVREAS